MKECTPVCTREYATVAARLPEGRPFAVALTVLLVITLIGFVLAILIPRPPPEIG